MKIIKPEEQGQKKNSKTHIPVSGLTVTALAPTIRGLYSANGVLTLVEHVGSDLVEDASTTLDIQLSFPDTSLNVATAIGKALQSFRVQNSDLPQRLTVRGVQNKGGKAEESITFRIVRTADSADSITSVFLGKIVFICGAAQGIGEGIVRMLVKKGARVVLADINNKQVEHLSRELNKEHNRTVSWAMRLDVSDEQSVQEAAEKHLNYCGGLDILISSAAISISGSIEDLESKDFIQSTAVNYTGFYFLVKHFAPIMKQQQQAHPGMSADIIQINSKSGLRGSEKNFAYAGSKFGGIGLCQSFALELASSNIKVNAICPGNFFDGPLWSDPEKGLFVQFLKAGKVPGARTVDDIRRYYLAQAPLGRALERGCRVEDIMHAVEYIVRQQYETGQSINVSGGQIM